jgi:hypothetical protein
MAMKSLATISPMAHYCTSPVRRYGGEFSQYINGWSELYVKERINMVHPELEGHMSDEQCSQAKGKVLYPFNVKDYLDY